MGLINSASTWDERYPDLKSPAQQEAPIVFVERVSSIKDLNVESELLRHYYDTQDLMKKNSNQPLSQQVQNMNSIVNILKTITEMQVDVYNMERLKKFEGTLIEVLKEFPIIQAVFLEKYKAALSGV